MGFSNMYKDHYELVRFLSRLEMEWNKIKAGDAYYEFEVFSADKDIFLNIKGKYTIRKVMAAYRNVMLFVKTCKDEGRTNGNIMPITFLMGCHATEVNYIPEKGPLNVASIHPTQVIYQDDKTTIVYWSDNTKTVVTCSDEDTFSKEAGFAFAYMKRIMGNNDKTFFHQDLKNYVGRAIVKHKVKPVEDEEFCCRCMNLKKIAEEARKEILEEDDKK